MGQVTFPHHPVGECRVRMGILIRVKFKAVLFPLCHSCIPRSVMTGSKDVNILKALGTYFYRLVSSHRPSEFRTY